MDLKLKDKTAFISGSTQGIGFAIAESLLSEGANVVINGRNKDSVDKAVIKLQHKFPNQLTIGIAANLSDNEQVEDLIRKLPDIDILINNVGVFNIKEFNEISIEEWKDIFDINVLSAIRLTKGLMKKMLDRNWGRVIFISSESAIDIPSNMIHYGTTKCAMLAISNGLSKLTKNTEVTVNTILGGPTYSDGVANAVNNIADIDGVSVEDIKSQIILSDRPNSLLGRFIEPKEIADIVTFLSSPLTIAVNGASIRVDGGVTSTI